MAVVTLSREFGSGGDEIARIICRETGYHYFDKEMIAHAAVEAGLSEPGALAIKEDEYQVSGFLDRLLRRQPPVAEVRFWREEEGGVRTEEVTQLGEDQMVEVVQKAIVMAYRHGNFVIVGRGGQAILRNLPGVLHVRVFASLDERILRLRNSAEFTAHHALKPGVSSQYDIRRTAQNLLETRDTASQDYLKRHFGVNWNDPTLYDIIVNTSRLNLETASRLIIEAAKMLDAA